MNDYLSEETKQKIIDSLIRKIDVLKEDKRALYKVIEDLQGIIDKQKETIKELESNIIKPSFDVGDKVYKFLGDGIVYIVLDYMYDKCYPVYNLVNESNEQDIVTIPEVDLIKVDL